MIPVYSFVAWSGTGKTTYLTALIGALAARGIRTALVKHDAHRFEIDREGFTYTADTMVALAKEYPEAEFYFIIGGDSLMKFHCWVKPEVISQHAVLLAAGRNGYTRNALLEQSERLKMQFGTKVLLLDVPDMSVSSNEIRMYCAKMQYEMIKSLVPESVYEYIMEHNLWKYPTT